jgi:hypothetical protein
MSTFRNHRDLLVFGIGAGSALLLEQVVNWARGGSVDLPLFVVVVSCLLMAKPRLWSPPKRVSLVLTSIGFLAILGSVALYTWTRVHP